MLYSLLNPDIINNDEANIVLNKYYSNSTKMNNNEFCEFVLFNIPTIYYQY